MDPRHELLQGFLFIVCGVYCVWCWSKGQTLAMRTWRIRVVDRQGRPLTQGRAMLRYLYCWIWVVPPLAALQARPFTGWQLTGLFLGWVAFWALTSQLQRDRQFWHDIWAGTRLVDAPPPR